MLFRSEKRLQHARYILSQEGLIIKEYKKYTQNVKQSSSDGEEKSKLLGEIEKLARDSSVFLANIKPMPVEKVGFYKIYAVEIDAESGISYLVDFIYQLEKSPHLLRIKDFRLVPKKGKAAILKAHMTIREILITPKKILSKGAVVKGNSHNVGIKKSGNI